MKYQLFHLNNIIVSLQSQGTHYTANLYNINIYLQACVSFVSALKGIITNSETLFLNPFTPELKKYILPTF